MHLRGEKHLYGDLPQWYRVKKVTDQLAPLRRQRVMNDSRFEQGVGRWATCMRAEGYAYSQPADARKAALASNGGIDRAEEIAIAIAEEICAKDTGLTETIHQMDEQYRRDLSAQYRYEVERKRALELAALPQASDIVKRQEARP
jgi:hypothetical protein